MIKFYIDKDKFQILTLESDNFTYKQKNNKRYLCVEDDEKSPMYDINNIFDSRKNAIECLIIYRDKAISTKLKQINELTNEINILKKVEIK